MRRIGLAINEIRLTSEGAQHKQTYMVADSDTGGLVQTGMEEGLSKLVKPGTFFFLGGG